jgi:hypothetical protein
VASIIERINFDCPINLMLAIISLTAPLIAYTVVDLVASVCNKRVTKSISE